MLGIIIISYFSRCFSALMYTRCVYFAGRSCSQLVRLFLIVIIFYLALWARLLAAGWADLISAQIFDEKERDSDSLSLISSHLSRHPSNRQNYTKFSNFPYHTASKACCKNSSRFSSSSSHRRAVLSHLSRFCFFTMNTNEWIKHWQQWTRDLRFDDSLKPTRWLE